MNEPRAACHNCGAWLEPGEDYECHRCLACYAKPYGYLAAYRKRSNPALVAERCGPWDRYREVLWARRVIESPPLGECPYCGRRDCNGDNADCRSLMPRAANAAKEKE